MANKALYTEKEPNRIELEEVFRKQWRIEIIKEDQATVSIYMPTPAECVKILWHTNQQNITFPIQFIRKQLHEHPQLYIINSLSQLFKQLKLNHQSKEPTNG